MSGVLVLLTGTRSPISASPCAGRTDIRDKLLEARGYRVISIPWFDWSVNTTLAAKQQYLRKRLPSGLFPQ